MDRVACASTGNTSASMASYAAMAGMKAYVFIPEGKVAFGKLSQALAYGATTIQIAGGFDVAMRLVQEACDARGVYLLNSINPFRIEGQKAIAFELLQDLDWSVPDWIVVPGGNLGNSAAIGKGLSELLRSGPDPAPSEAGRDPGLRAPIRSSPRFERGTPVVPLAEADTRATAIRIGDPISWRKSLRGVTASGGVVDEVSDQEILDAEGPARRLGHRRRARVVRRGRRGAQARRRRRDRQARAGLRDSDRASSEGSGDRGRLPPRRPLRNHLELRQCAPEIGSHAKGRALRDGRVKRRGGRAMSGVVIAAVSCSATHTFSKPNRDSIRLFGRARGRRRCTPRRDGEAPLAARIGPGPAEPAPGASDPCRASTSWAGRGFAVSAGGMGENVTTRAGSISWPCRWAPGCTWAPTRWSRSQDCATRAPSWTAFSPG